MIYEILTIDADGHALAHCETNDANEAHRLFAGAVGSPPPGAVTIQFIKNDDVLESLDVALSATTRH